ncbi:MAG: galactose-1-phosphate uridylyltransferase [Candidatus Coatesbacteria bacterium]|nr:MAG: galactose-1-phosphate uridylyltransferase [Candidatus Coatesbacteria bacterium]
MPELRKDPVVERWCIIAAGRGKRPSDFVGEREPHFTPEGEKSCPFCYGREDRTPPELAAYGRPPDAGPNTPGWTVRVVPNKFPALQRDGEFIRTSDGVYDRMSGIGAHEIIVETPDHYRTLDNMDVSAVAGMLRAFSDRMLDLENDDRFKYVQVFKNFGVAAGASLEHPHCQLIATPVVPKRIIEELKGALEYHEFKERCVFCDVVQRETSDGTRVVLEDDYFVSIVPFASRFPFEVHILPKKHIASFTEIAEDDAYRFSVHLKTMVGKISLAFGEPPYNFMLHTAPCRRGDLAYYHWHLELIPKLAKAAGFEWGTGFYINPTVPEQAAKDLREVPFEVNEAEAEVQTV